MHSRTIFEEGWRDMWTQLLVEDGLPNNSICCVSANNFIIALRNMSIKSSALDAESTESAAAAAAGCELSSGKRITKQETIRKQEWVTDWLTENCVCKRIQWLAGAEEPRELIKFKLSIKWCIQIGFLTHSTLCKTELSLALLILDRYWASNQDTISTIHSPCQQIRLIPARPLMLISLITFWQDLIACDNYVSHSEEQSQITQHSNSAWWALLLFWGLPQSQDDVMASHRGALLSSAVQFIHVSQSYSKPRIIISSHLGVGVVCRNL